MTAQDYWSMFMETGAPEWYLMYNRALRMEKSHVLDDTGPGCPGRSLQ